MTNTFQHAFYVCLNQGEAYAPAEITRKSVCMNEDIGEILKELQTCDKVTRSCGSDRILHEEPSSNAAVS